MTSNRDRAAEVLYNESVGSRDTRYHLVDALADAGLLAPDGYRTSYGVWYRSPSGEEGYDWVLNDSHLPAAEVIRLRREARQ